MLLHSEIIVASVGTPTSERLTATVLCSITALKKLQAMPPKSFSVKEESIFGQSSEGGTLTLFFRGGTLQRTNATLFGETGQVEIEAAQFSGDASVTIKWTEYVEPLPKLPVRIRRAETLTGFVCSGQVIVDRIDPNQQRQHGTKEFQQLVSWLFAELRDRKKPWNVQIKELKEELKK